MKNHYTYDQTDSFLDAGEYLYEDTLLEEENDYTDRPRNSKQRIEDYLEQRRLRDLLDEMM